jgi:hypothetical protein
MLGQLAALKCVANVSLQESEIVVRGVEAKASNIGKYCLADLII